MNVELNRIYGELVAVKKYGLIIRQMIWIDKRTYQYVYVPFNEHVLPFVGSKKECEKESLIKRRIPRAFTNTSNTPIEF